MIPDVEHPTWGIDPSTRRIALAIVLPGRRFVTRALELGSTPVDAGKLAMARFTMHGWFASLAEEFDPGWLWCEQPFAKRQEQVPVESWLMLGVVMEAAYTATRAPANLVPPVSWKADAVGHGFASKRRVLDWARGLGFAGDCERCEPSGKCKGAAAHDLADALGVAVAGAVFVAARTNAVHRTANTGER